jgi:hypothetical protein
MCLKCNVSQSIFHFIFNGSELVRYYLRSGINFKVILKLHVQNDRMFLNCENQNCCVISSQNQAE